MQAMRGGVAPARGHPQQQHHHHHQLQAPSRAATTAIKPSRRRRCRDRRALAASSSPQTQTETSTLSRSALLRRLAPATTLLAAAGVLSSSAAVMAADPEATATTSFPRTLRPDELAAVRRALASAAPKPKAPVLLRLVFHDAGTFDAASGDGGANASVRLELDRPENGGLKRGWRVVEAIRKEVAASPQLNSLLSDADLIALAGAHAVVVTGGPSDLLARVRVGREDTASPDPEGRLPSENASPPELVAAFGAKTLSRDEMIALSGAHTLGSKGFGDPLTFDNAYYTTLLAKPWNDPKTQMPEMIGLASDRLLPDDAACLPAIERYASDGSRFFDDFSSAYLKLTELGAVWRVG
jgi:L-ascorbate peroxidase